MTVPITFDSPSPRKDYTIKYHSWAQTITEEKLTCYTYNFFSSGGPTRKAGLRVVYYNCNVQMFS